MSPSLEPLRHAPAAWLQSIEGVAFDIDDTVTRGGVLEAEAFDAMWRLHRAGVKLIAATGRPLGWVDVVARHWPVDAAVGENGLGWVWRDGERVHEGYALPEPERARARERLLRIQARIQREFPLVPLTGDTRARREDIAFDIGETVQVPENQIVQILDLIRAEGALPTRSTVHAHAGPPGADKATGITAAARDALGVDLSGAARERWVFIGDSPNDEAAFRHFPQTVGVANVARFGAELRPPPRWVTDGDRGRGFAELAAAILTAKGVGPGAQGAGPNGGAA